MKKEFDSIIKALEQLKSGKSLFGKENTFVPLLESILNASLEGEIDKHLDEQERLLDNRRYEHTPKRVQIPLG